MIFRASGLHYFRYYLIHNTITPSSYFSKHLVSSLSERLVIIKEMVSWREGADSAIVGDYTVAILVKDGFLLEFEFFVVGEP
jgi:hypothetical protein